MSQSALRRLRFAPHAADLFADPGAGYVYPESYEGVEDTPGTTMHERKFQSTDHDHFAQAPGERTSEVKFSLEGRGFGGVPAGAGSAVVAGDGELGLLLKTCFGAQSKDTGSIAAAGTTAAVIKLAATANITLGAFVGVVDPAGGLLHVRQVRAKTGTDLTLDRPLPFVPATGATVYASNSFTHAIDGHQHLFFDVEGYDSAAAKGYRRSHFGCIGDFTLSNLAANGKFAFGFSFRGLHWDDPAQGAAMPAGVVPANLPKSGGTIRNTRVSVGPAVLDVAELGYELGNEIQGKPSAAAKNGVARWVVVDAKQTMSLKVAVDDAHAAGIYVDSVGNVLDLLLELTQGGPGNSFALAAPAAQILAVAPAALNGLDYYEVALAAQRSGIVGVAAVTLGMI